MSENEQAVEEPVFRVQRIYVKDISFENPNAPEIFDRSGKQPKVEMNLQISNRMVYENQWEVSLKVSAETRDTDSDKLLFQVEVEHAALFYLKNIPEQHLPMVLAVDCPTVILPYSRQVISQLTVDGGFMPFLLEPVNFRGLYESQRQKEATEEEHTIQ